LEKIRKNLAAANEARRAAGKPEAAKAD